MRVFVAGASGVIGRPLTRELVEAGHEAIGTTSREENTAAIEATPNNNNARFFTIPLLAFLRERRERRKR